MKRLLIASGIFHPESGGPATYLNELLPALQLRGWDIRVLTYGNAPTDGYPYPVKRIPRRILPLRLVQYGLASRPLLQWADVVFCHTIDLPLWGARTAPRVIKIVGDRAWERAIERGLIPPETGIDDFQQNRFSPFVEYLKRSRSRQVAAMDAVIVPSDYLAQMVRGWGIPAARIHRIYNALPPPVDIPQTRAELRAELNLPDAPVLLTAARLKPWKGIDHIIAALTKLPDVHLIVAGDGDDLPRLKSLAAPLGERVHFAGYLDRAVLYRYMRAVDYFVLYTGYEGLPHTALESLRLGTPVIASDMGGNPEVVKHDVNGLLVPYVDRDALTAAFEHTFTGSTRERLSAATLKTLKPFEFQTMLNKTEEILKRAPKKI